MKQLLIETLPFKPTPFSLTESKLSERGNPIVGGVLATANKREIEKYMDSVKENRAMGELDHPDSNVVNLKNVSHNIKDIYWDGDNVMGKIEILPTPSGNILRALIQSGITVGVSSRGMGSLKQMGETLEVQDDFELLCWDFVSTPSNPGSFMEVLKEGLSKPVNKYDKVNSIITEILCSMGSCPL